ncbi:nitroreductase [Coprinopsis marcescibilis]|uniref:Nitroreductase n=1 Tax=Coprinopsis marcescibilis TaxID=230819 RepID=A0A5C3KZJ4_COPMA|nr:nitroreductase [Coprinopsis marcescibilis]
MTMENEDLQGTVSKTDSLMKTRFSCRYYLDKEVPRHTLEDIIEVARFAPSGNNIQPWEKVHCITGARLKLVQTELLKAFQENPEGHKAEYTYYPTPVTLMPEVFAHRRQETGRILGQALNIDRADAVRRAEVAGRNYRFYDAPVALVFTIDRRLEKGSWIDLGFFIQSIIIAARARGLETCTQESIAQFHEVLRKHIPIADNEIVVVGMAIGYPDVEATERQVDDIIQFHVA